MQKKPPVNHAKGKRKDSTKPFPKFLSTLRDLEPLLRAAEVVIVSAFTISITYNANRAIGKLQKEPPVNPEKEERKGSTKFFSKVLNALSNLEPLLRFLEVTVVSVLTIIIANNANRIAEKELQAENAALQPKFEVSEHYEHSDSSDEMWMNSVLEISNLGEPFSNIEFSTICILEFYSLSDSYVSENFKLIGFYLAHIWTDNKVGLICTSKAYHNWYNYWQFSKNVLDFGIGYTDLKKYVKISYEDQLGENHLQYYEVNSTRSKQLSEYEGNTIFEEYNGLEKSLDIDKLVLDNLTRTSDVPSNGLHQNLQDFLF